MKNNYNKGMIKLFFFCEDNSKKLLSHEELVL